MAAGRRPINTIKTTNNADLIETPDGGRAVDLERANLPPRVLHPDQIKGTPEAQSKALAMREARQYMTPLRQEQKRAATSMAIMIRERCPAELMVEYHMQILAGFDPFMRVDLETGEWFVWVDPEDMKLSSPERRDASMKVLREYAHGLPAQKHQIDVDVQRASAGGQVVDPALIGGLNVLALMNLERLLADPTSDPLGLSPATRAAAVDASATEVVEVLPADDTVNDETQHDDETAS